MIFARAGIYRYELIRKIGVMINTVSGKSINGIALATIYCVNIVVSNTSFGYPSHFYGNHSL
jgi:hypothetical protein